MQRIVQRRMMGAEPDYVVTCEDLPEYSARPVLAGAGRSYVIFDGTENAVAGILERPVPVEPNFQVTLGGMPVGEIHQDLSASAVPRFYLGNATSGFTLGGAGSPGKLVFTNAGVAAGLAERALSFVGPRYLIDVYDGGDIPIALCLLIVWDLLVPETG